MNPIILYFTASMIVSGPFVQNNVTTNISSTVVKKVVKGQSVIPTKNDVTKTWTVCRSNEPLVHDGGAILPDKKSKPIDITVKSNDDDTVNVASNETEKICNVVQ